MFLSLNGVTVPNNGYVLAKSIGGDGILATLTEIVVAELQTITIVLSRDTGMTLKGMKLVYSYTDEHTAEKNNNSIFTRARGSGIVHLYCNGNPAPERGRFCYEIPNASGNTETCYVNIGECFISAWPMDYIHVLF